MKFEIFPILVYKAIRWLVCRQMSTSAWSRTPVLRSAITAKVDTSVAVIQAMNSIFSIMSPVVPKVDLLCDPVDYSLW